MAQGRDGTGMAPVYNPTVARVIVRGAMDGQTITNSLHVDSPEDWTTARLNELNGLVASWLSVDYMPLLSNTYQVNEIQVDSLAGINAPAVIDPLSPALIGARTSPALPNNVSLSVSLKTGFRGRSARGRWFVAGICEDQVNASRVTAGFRSDVQAQFAELGASLVSANMRPVVYSTVSNGAPRPLGVAFPVNAFVVVDDVVDSQRRRLPRRGI